MFSDVSRMCRDATRDTPSQIYSRSTTDILAQSNDPAVRQAGHRMQDARSQNAAVLDLFSEYSETRDLAKKFISDRITGKFK